MIPSDTIKTAHGKIKSYIRETPVLHAREFHDLEVHLKLENFQVTGSFKARGGLNKLCSLTDADRNKGIVTASSGNHGAAVSFGANALGCEAHVFVPEGADPSKIAAIRSYGATVDTHGHDCSLTEAHARQTANATGKTYVSPYNDLDVIAGQGTIAVELQSQLAKLDAIFVSVGGGGLIAGIGSYIKSCGLDTKIIACSPEQSPAMHACLEAGAIVEVPCYPTLSDATAGGVEPGSVTYDLCAEVIDTSILVSEDESRSATRHLIETHHMLVEGAAGVALAGLLKLREQFRAKRVAVVICGANIGIDKLRQVLAPGPSASVAVD